MAILYKFIDDLIVLQNMTLLASDPAGFNDPFEVRPCYDQETHEHFCQGSEDLHHWTGSAGHALIADAAMASFPAETVFGLPDKLNKRFREDLSKKYRALCLSSSAESVLMWGHYGRLKGGKPYSGVVVGIDTNHPDFPTGIRAEGFPIDYDAPRSSNRLPLAYYNSPGVERWGEARNGRWEMLNKANELVSSNAGLAIPFSLYWQQLQETFLKALTMKAKCWEYEAEIRFLYDLEKHARTLRRNGGRDLIDIPRDALKEVILGPQATGATAQSVVDFFRDGRLGQPELYFSDCHPFEYKVRKAPMDANGILSHYQIVLPSLAPREF